MKNLKFREKRSSFLYIAAVLTSVVFGVFWGCSSDSNDVAGNSAETGSPELASLSGDLYLADGSPASLARVRCVPSSFDVLYQSFADSLQTETDEKGAFSLKSLPAGSYSLEATHPGSGELLLVQNVEIPESGDVLLVDSLQSAGYALLKVDLSEEDEGTEGVAYALGTTIFRSVRVEGGFVLVDSLPAGDLNLVIRLDDGHDFTANYDDLKISAGDTLKVGADTSAVDSVVEDAVILRYSASLALPVALDSSMGDPSRVNGIPLAFRLDSSNCNFADFDSLEGRWESYRISSDGTRGNSLPITVSLFDVEAKKAVFWVRVDSLNASDSVELVFDTSKNPVYAQDVFPTNRAFTAVYHYDDGVDSFVDASEKNGYTAKGQNVAIVDGVVGRGVELSGATDSYVVVENSALSDTSRPSNLNFGSDARISFSLWVRLDDLSKSQTLFSKGTSQYDLRFAPDTGFVVEIFHEFDPNQMPERDDMGKDPNGEPMGFKLEIAGGLKQIAKGKWTHVAFTSNGSYDELYIDGRNLRIPAKKIAWNGKRDESKDLTIGPFAGAVDEFSIGNDARYDIWMNVSYLNQKPVDFWPVFGPVK